VFWGGVTSIFFSNVILMPCTSLLLSASLGSVQGFLASLFTTAGPKFFSPPGAVISLLNFYQGYVCFLVRSGAVHRSVERLGVQSRLFEPCTPLQAFTTACSQVHIWCPPLIFISSHPIFSSSFCLGRSATRCRKGGRLPPFTRIHSAIPFRTSFFRFGPV